MSGAEVLVERWNENPADFAHEWLAGRQRAEVIYEIESQRGKFRLTTDALASLAAELVIAQKVARQWEQFGEQKEARIAELEKLVHTQAEEAAKAAREYADNMERMRGELEAAREALEPFARIADMDERLPKDAATTINIELCRKARAALKGTPSHE